MSSQTEIINHALTRLGETRIQDVTEDTKPAREALAVWDSLLESELFANSWAFASRRASLAASTTAPTWGYSYAYPIPSDCIAITFVKGQNVVNLDDYRDSSDPIYKVEGREILTNLEAPLYIQYTALVTDPNEWDPGFRYAFGLRLAQELCFSLTQRADKEQLLARDYSAAIQKAAQRSAIQMPPQNIQDSSWIASRDA